MTWTMLIALILAIWMIVNPEGFFGTAIFLIIAAFWISVATIILGSIILIASN